MGLGNRPRALDMVLVTTALDRVLEHEPADLTATVEAGIPLGELNARLERQGQFLPLEAPEPRRATIGGLLATAGTGPRTIGHL
ncbi:MAG: FAD-binding protein [Dehalococcoidia bacterium]|nr:FAD-binding protein [Dehalococcoidia bacterium]